MLRFVCFHHEVLNLASAFSASTEKITRWLPSSLLTWKIILAKLLDVKLSLHTKINHFTTCTIIILFWNQDYNSLTQGVVKKNFPCFYNFGKNYRRCKLFVSWKFGNISYKYNGSKIWRARKSSRLYFNLLNYYWPSCAFYLFSFYIFPKLIQSIKVSTKRTYSCS